MADTKASVLTRTLMRYTLACLAVGAGFLLRTLLGWAGAPELPTYITFYPAIMTVALLLGFGPGLCATLLTAVLVAYWVLEPRGSFAIRSTSELVGVPLFVGMGVFMSVVAALYRRARFETVGKPAANDLKPQNQYSGQSLLLYAGFMVSMAILGTVGWLSHREFTAAIDADRLITRTYVVIDQLYEVLSTLKDAETSQHGYVITGEERYVAAYEAALVHVRANLSSVKRLTEDNPIQQRRLARVESLVLDKLEELKETIELRQTKGFPAARDMVSADRGRQVTDDLLKEVSQAQVEETGLLKRRSDERDTSILMTLRVLVAGGIASVLLLGSVFLFLKIENTRRMKAEAELIRQQDHLEDMVTERTRELDQANARLKEEIAEHLQAKESLRLTVDDLARSNRDLEQFAYVTSHDLQEPLRQVRGFVKLLLERHANRLDAKASQYMEFVADGAERMSRLIADLLAYSRVGAREVRRQPVDLQNALCAALANLSASIAQAKAVVTHDELPTVVADSTQLTQLFQNLVGNAVKFHRDGAPPTIHVGARRDGDNWLFWVKDDGIGISPEHHERVFLIFQRLHSREKYAGTGIGLALCKKIVEQHRGSIWVDSKPGEGSTFYFTLPGDGAA